jgi:predicted acylesterase/phospholipase RssA
MAQIEKYERCMVLAGGGLRFGYYLGMHAAMVRAGSAPDVLLASCGGAIAAAVIGGLPDDAARKAWLSSPSVYAFLCSLQSTPSATIGRALWHAALRRCTVAPAPRIPDLFDDVLFDVGGDLPLPPLTPGAGPDLAIVGGKLLFDRSEVGQVRGQRKLFAETIFCQSRAAGLLDGMAAPMGAARWGNSAIAPGLLIDQAMPLADAVRISMADMYYFSCHGYQGQYYTGGVIDLFPIEIAAALARHIVMERKAPFRQLLAIPALRAVLGINGNERLREVHEQDIDVWIDSSDVEQVLRAVGTQKKLCWSDNRIRLVPPPDYAAYVRDVDLQWEYGFQRAQEAVAARAAGHAAPMRLMNKYNRGKA